MKHYLLKLAFVFFLSFAGINGAQVNAQEWTAWSQWTSATCYHNISYRSRTRPADDKDYVQMEIKNNFNQGISISHFISNDATEPAIYRIDISPGGVYTSEQYVDRDSRYYLILDKLRFTGDKPGDPYRDCDGRMAKAEEDLHTNDNLGDNKNASGTGKRDSVTTDSKTWQSLDEEDQGRSAAASSYQRSAPGSGRASGSSGHSRSGSRTADGDNTMSWEAQQRLAKRQHEIRQQEQAQLGQALEPMGETLVMMDNMIPDATKNWADLYLGADDADGLSAWRLGIESRMYHGDKFIIYFGFAGILAPKFKYYFADDESSFTKAINAENRLGLELQLGIGSRILGDEENEEDAGSALYWGLLGYIGGIDGGDMEKPDDVDGFNVMGFYGPRLLIGYRMSHVSLRFSYSLCFTDKRYYMGLGTPPGAEDKNMSGLVQVQLAYSW